MSLKGSKVGGVRGVGEKKEKGALLSQDCNLKSTRNNKSSVGGKNCNEPSPEHTEDYHPHVQMINYGEQC